MYFHLIWIKEKNWKKYDLNMILWWWDENFIRSFLSHLWVVIVSLDEFKEDPKSFWNIITIVLFEDLEIQLIMSWDNLEEACYFTVSIGLEPVSINNINEPIPDEQMKAMISSNLERIKQEEEEIKKQQELIELNEQKKYEEACIKDALRVINENIIHIEQILKAWQWIISWTDIKKLEDYLNEMKKIRLWTNFNKMAALVLDANILIKNVENEIFTTYDSKKFIIDRNSSITNIDVLREYFHSNRIAGKAVFQPRGLTLSESVANIAWENMVLVNLLLKDIAHNFNTSSFDELFKIVMNLIELITLVIIVVISLLWLFWLISWMGNFSLYLLPALWWLGLLLYLLNNLELNGAIPKIVWFSILVLLYWQWLTLLLNTFAL